MACKCENTDRKIVCRVSVDGKTFSFTLPEKILPYILSSTPKIFYFNFYLDNRKFTELVDLSHITMPVKKTADLKVVIRQNTEKKAVERENSYSIARGESFQDRFLSYSGWVNEEFLFPLKEETKTAEKRQEAATVVSQPAKDGQDKPKIKLCPFCNAVLPSDFDYCPYCKKYVGEPDKHADITI